ncbi:E3 SUMO-protein ligase MMS21, partial [Camellia lanceoleosa]
LWFQDYLAKEKTDSTSNVHHVGQPMPGEEQEDLVMTSTQFNLLTIKCPLTRKPITELEEPVRSVNCKHIYEKNVIMQYIRSKNIQCPVAGCPRILKAARVACDPLLLVEIEEMRLSTKHSVRPDMVEDFTELDEEDSGVTLLLNEPPDARKPDIRWRLYVFKAGEVLNASEDGDDDDNLVTET